MIIHFKDKLLFELQQGVCFYCDSRLSKKSYTKDHFYPKSKGYHLTGNKVLCCKWCNESKSDKWPSHEHVMKFKQLYCEGAVVMRRRRRK